MVDDPNDWIAESFHGLVANVQSKEIRDFEQAREEERLRELELRQQQGVGMTASELLKDIYGTDPDKQQAKLDAENDRITREVADAVAQKKKDEEQLPVDRFPPPTITT